jgi:hypothetical protein
MVGPLVGADGDPIASTINVKKRRRWAPWEVPELEIRECPSLTLRNIDDGPLGGIGAGDPGAHTVNAKKCQWRAP